MARMVGATQKTCVCPLIAILVKSAIAKNMAFNIFITAVFRVIKIYEKKLNSVNDKERGIRKSIIIS